MRKFRLIPVVLLALIGFAASAAGANDPFISICGVKVTVGVGGMPVTSPP